MASESNCSGLSLVERRGEMFVSSLCIMNLFKLKKVRSCIEQYPYPVLGTVRSALHFKGFK